jgi:lipoprotein-anchoring transpeptidase ErfK/SrfK
MKPTIPMLSVAICWALAGHALPARAESATWINPATYQQSAIFASAIRRQEVAYETTQPPGTIVVDTQERRLYLVLENGRAIR